MTVTWAEPPDDLKIFCKNCGKEIELENLFGESNWVHVPEEGQPWFETMECTPTIIKVEEKASGESNQDHEGQPLAIGG